MSGIQEKYVNELLVGAKENQSSQIYEELIKPLGTKTIDLGIYVKNLITGGDKKAFKNVDEIFSNPSISSGNPLADLKMSSNRMFTTDTVSNLESYILNGNAQIAKDINDNIMVFFPNGSYGYHNEPGISKADITQILGSAVTWSGAGRVNAAINKALNLPLTNYRFFDNAVKNMAQAGTFSIGQDLIAELTGSKQGIVGDKLIFNVGASLIAPGAGLIFEKLPVVGAKNIIKRSRSAINVLAPKFINKDGSVQNVVLDEFKEIGVNPENFSPQEQLIYGKARELGYSKETSKAYMNSYKFDIDLFDAQITRDEGTLFKLNEALKGSINEEIQKDLLLLLEEQNQQLFNAVKKLSGLPEDFSLTEEKLSQNQKQSVGRAIQTLTIQARNAAESKYTGLYENLDIGGNIQPKGLETLKGNINLALKEDSVIDTESEFFKQDFPKTSLIYRRINAFADKYKAKNGENPKLMLKELENTRSQISTDAFNSSGSDSSSAKKLLDEFDKFEGDFYDNLLENTSQYTEDEINAIRNARNTYAEYRKTFFKNAIDKYGGRDNVGKFLQDTMNGNLGPTDIIKHLNGLKDTGNSQEAFRKISGLYKMLDFLEGEEKEIATRELSNKLKESFHLNLIDTSLKYNKQTESISINPKIYADNVTKYLGDTDLKNSLKLFMTDAELEETKLLADFMLKTKPAMFNNASNTAATLQKHFQNRGIAQGLTQNIGKLYAYNTGGLKGLFTFRTLSSLKGRKTGIAPEIEKNLEQNLQDLPDDLRTAIGFVLTSNVGKKQMDDRRSEEIESRLNIGKLQTIKTLDDIKNMRKKAMGYDNLSKEEQEQIIKQMKNFDEFSRVFR
tara:strand:- start:510 stop:3050 length:2541 start_codon:yes stop_codon:yes gene_type:complete